MARSWEIEAETAWAARFQTPGEPTHLMQSDLLQSALRGEARFFLQYSGQGNSFLLELRRLHRLFPELSDYFETIYEAIDHGLTNPELRASDMLPLGFDLRSWLRKENVPPSAYLNACTISLPATELTQLAYYTLLLKRGYGELLKHCVIGLTGHSQGVLSAVFASLALQGDEWYLGLKRHVQFLLFGGFRCQQTTPIPKLAPTLIAESEERDGEAPTPMASLTGTTRRDLQPLLDEFNRSIPEARALTISLYNTPDSMIVSGLREDVFAFRKEARGELERRKVRWNYLDISAPFHSHLMPPGVVGFRRDLEWMGYDYRGDQLKLPVYSTHDGRNLQEMESLGEYLFLLQSSYSLDWPLTLQALLADRTVTHVIDCGPGRVSAALTADLLQRAHHPARMLAMAAKGDLAELVGAAEE